MTKIILKNADVFYQGKIQRKDVVIEDKIIVAIQDDVQETGQVYDLTGQLITLGFVDIHTHLRQPGFEHKETVATGSKSAMYGGYTHIVAMANTNPCMDNVEVIQQFDELVKKDAAVHTYTFSAITKGLAGEELVDFENNIKADIVLGFSDDGRGVQSDEMMEAAMKKAKAVDSIIVAHCEDENELEPGACIHAGKYAKDNDLVGINSASEYRHAMRDLKLVETIGNRYHICHISTKETVGALKEARQKGLMATGEVCPHHIILTDENIKDCHPNYKMNPPLRSKEDLDALIEGLNDGTITVIATDHAPHTIEEKNQPIDIAPFGIIGNQHAFMLMNTYIIQKNKMSLETVLTAMSSAPAQVVGLDHRFEIGAKANLCVLDLNQDYKITIDNIVSKSKNTPFLDVVCKGVATYHILDGKITKLQGE